MQVPEKLSLIGGSILLASTLIFTLKSQASNILPKVNSGMSEMFKSDQERQQDQQKQQEQAFNNNFQQAQQKGWQTGQWGSSKYYIDDGNNLHVGSGQLQGSYTNVADINKIQTIDLDGPVQAPQNSHSLFATTGQVYNNALRAINNLSNLDTSHTTDMSDMFYDDGSLRGLDVSHFNTSNVTDISGMFEDDNSLSNLDLSHFDTSKVINMYYMFHNNSSLSALNLSSFDTSNVINVDDMFYGNNFHQLSLGPNTKIQNNPSDFKHDSSLSGVYQSNGQTLNLDGNAHPGTWVKQ